MGLFSKAEPVAEPTQTAEVASDNLACEAWVPVDPEAAYRRHLLERFEDTKAQLARASAAEGRAADLSIEAQTTREAVQEQHREAALALRRVADGAVR